MGNIRVINCRGCGSPKLKSIKSFGCFPYANGFPDVHTVSRKRYPLSLVVCEECTLCQLNEYPDLEELYSDYIWLTSSSKTIHMYLDELKEYLLNLRNGPFSKIVEIASNDATLLKKFEGQVNRRIAVEPAKNLKKFYKNTNIELISELFDNDCVTRNKNILNETSLVIARNVLAHVPDIMAFLQACKSCLSRNGFLYLEFHDGDEIIKKLQFDSIYHEHQSYITGCALRHILKSAGFEIHSSWLGPIGGSSRSVIAYVPEVKNNETQDSCSHNMNKEMSNIEYQRWVKFRIEVDTFKNNLDDILSKAFAKNLNVVGFGASARSTTLANFCELSRWLAAIVDSSTNKHGKLWTGTDLVVKSPSSIKWEEIDIVLLLAWNFEEEILNQLTKLGFIGQILRVLPNRPKYVDLSHAN